MVIIMNMELEVKILEIDIATEKSKILKLGGKYVGDFFQQLYTYDLPSIFGRYQEIISHLENPGDEIEFDVNRKKLEMLFWEVDNLQANTNFSFLNSNSICSFSDILTQPNWIDLLRKNELKLCLANFGNNPNKWIRLRKTDKKVTLAVKHILSNRDSSFQQLSESEIEVSSFEETDILLQQLGYVFKSYQEKRRMVFELYDHEIDFDFWPGIPPYMEFEGKSEEDLIQILTTLGYSMNNVISCTADAVYKIYGKNMLHKRILTFNDT